jgi:hypothetical protein
MEPDHTPEAHVVPEGEDGPAQSQVLMRSFRATPRSVRRLSMREVCFASRGAEKS